MQNHVSNKRLVILSCDEDKSCCPLVLERDFGDPDSEIAANELVQPSTM